MLSSLADAFDSTTATNSVKAKADPFDGQQNAIFAVLPSTESVSARCQLYAIMFVACNGEKGAHGRCNELSSRDNANGSTERH